MYSSHSILFVKVTITLTATPNMDKMQLDTMENYDHNEL